MNKIVDLFAGCGGLSIGFQKAGFELIGAFEYWQAAINCYEENIHHKVFQADLSDTKDAVSRIRKLEGFSSDGIIIIGGPPCQDFSHAGKRIEAGRASLTGAYANIVCTVRPKCFVMENVDRAQKSNAYAYARSEFKNAGYGLTEIVLDASLCGVPQKRKRFFCIGILGEADNCLSKSLNGSLSKQPTTLREYYSKNNLQLPFEFYYRHPRNYSRRGIFSVDEPAPTMRGVNRPVPQGYLGHPNDPCPLGAGIRALSIQERATIQTFPQDYRWVGSKTDVEQMIGNAVPVRLAEYVASALKKYLNGQAVQTITNEAIDSMGFESWLNESFSYSPRTRNDYICRVRRANAILPVDTSDSPYYIFRLEQTAEYRMLKTDVRSQIKRSVSLYSQYRNGYHNSNGAQR